MRLYHPPSPPRDQGGDFEHTPKVAGGAIGRRNFVFKRSNLLRQMYTQTIVDVIKGNIV